MLPLQHALLNIPANLRSIWRGSLEPKWKGLHSPMKAGLWAGGLVAIYTLSLPNQFKSEARVLPAEVRGSGGGMAASAAASAGLSLPGSDGPDAIYMDILNSRSLREALLETKFSFKIRGWYFGSEQIKSQTLYDYIKKGNMDRAVKSLRDRITVVRDLKTKLVTITVETTSEDLSQQVTKRIVDLLNEFVVTKSQTRGGLKAKFSAQRLSEARGEMEQAEETFRVFLDGNRSYLTSPDPSVRLKGLRLDNELRLRTQVLSTLAIGREQALLEEKNDMPILNVLDPGNLPIDKSGPSRGMMVVASFLLGGLGNLAWRYRSWIHDRLTKKDETPSAPCGDSRRSL